MPATTAPDTHYRVCAERLLNQPWPAVNGVTDPAQLSAELAAHLNYYQLPTPSEQLRFSSAALTTAATERVVWYRWQPPAARRRALVVHGYMDHSGLYHHLIKELLARDCEVLCFDLPGHGLSSGKRASIDDFNHYQLALDALLAAVAQWPPLPLVGLGQSTGGAILLQHLVDHPAPEAPWQSLNLFAPLLEPARWSALRWLLVLLGPLLTTVPRSFKANSSNRDFNHFLAHRDPLQTRVIPLAWLRAMQRWIVAFKPRSGPAGVRIIQGDNDNTVAWRRNLANFARQFTALEVAIIHGAGHQLVNESAPLRTEAFAQIKF